MADVFIHVLNASFVCGWLILWVLLVRFLFRRASKSSLSLLWIFVVMKLLFPMRWGRFYTPYTLYPFRSRPIPPDILYQETPTVSLGIPAVDGIINGILPAGTPMASVNPLQIWAEAGGWIWALGAAVMFALAAASLVRLRWSLRGAVKLERGVYEAATLRTPFVLGLLFHRIYLPSGLTEEEKELVLAHERMHIRQAHHWLKAAAYAGLCIHWFNPLVWLAYRRLGEDTEICCDEQATLKMDAAQKKAYSELLLSMAADGWMGPLAFGESNVKRRIKRLLGAPPPAVLSLLAFLTVALVYWLGIITIPQDLTENMRRIQNLRQEEIAGMRIEAADAPRDRLHWELASDAFPQVLSFLRQAQGEPLGRDLDDWAGPVKTLWVDTVDGGVHQIENLDGQYLYIDGVYYGGSPWLESWDFTEYGPMAARKPDLAENQPRREG